MDYLAKKWDISEDEVMGALKECGLEIPEDEDAKIVYVEYDGDLFWVNINRRGELWVNTKEKSRPVFRTVQGARVEPEEAPEGSRGAAPSAARASRREPKQRGRGRGASSRPRRTPRRAAARRVPTLLDRIRPLMRKNRREPGGSGSMSFLSRALKCSEAALIEAFTAMGLSADSAAGDPPVFVEIGDESWWLNKDSRGGVWINARAEARRGPQPGAAARRPDSAAPAPATSLPPSACSSRRRRREASPRPVERLAGRTRQVAPTSSSARSPRPACAIPEKSREKPVFAEHAGEIFWLNLNGKGELWLNAKASKYSDDGTGDSTRRSRSKEKPTRPTRGPLEAPRGRPRGARRQAEAQALRRAATAPASCAMTGSVFSHERQASVTLRPRTRAAPRGSPAIPRGGCSRS